MYKQLLVSGIIVLFLIGCGKTEAVQPREINPEVDACEVCQMSIAHADFATQVVKQDGSSQIFDDLGCMMEYLTEDIEEEQVAGAFVRDMKEGDWVKLEEAYHVYHKDFWTPMAYGVVSFSSKEKAEEYIEEKQQGTLLSYQELASFDWGF